MDLTFFTTQNFFSRVISFRYLTARRARAFRLLVSITCFNFPFYVFSAGFSFFFPLRLFRAVDGVWRGSGLVLGYGKYHWGQGL